jgi:hypothetical protein
MRGLRWAVKGTVAFLAGARQMVQFLAFVCVNLQLRSSHIFFEMFDPGFRRNCGAKFGSVPCFESAGYRGRPHVRVFF